MMWICAFRLFICPPPHPLHGIRMKYTFPSHTHTLNWISPVLHAYCVDDGPVGVSLYQVTPRPTLYFSGTFPYLLCQWTVTPTCHMAYNTQSWKSNVRHYTLSLSLPRICWYATQFAGTLLSLTRLWKRVQKKGWEKRFKEWRSFEKVFLLRLKKNMFLRNLSTIHVFSV